MATSDLTVEKVKISDSHTEPPAPFYENQFITPAKVIEMDFSTAFGLPAILF